MVLTVPAEHKGFRGDTVNGDRSKEWKGKYLHELCGSESVWHLTLDLWGFGSLQDEDEKIQGFVPFAPLDKFAQPSLACVLLASEFG